MSEKCGCVKTGKCCEEAGCGDVVPVGSRFLWIEENGAEEGDLEHRLCRDCVSGK